MFKTGMFESVYNGKYQESYTPGDFSFMNDNLWRSTLEHDYKSIPQEGWDALKRHNPDKSFMWHTNGAFWDSIRNNMYGGHSAASQAISLRSMEQIAKSGWTEFVKSYIIKQERELAQVQYRVELARLRRSRESGYSSDPSS